MFEWDPAKNALNQEKHGISFRQATAAFSDLKRLIVDDFSHSHAEERFFCFGLVEGKVATVRFTRRGEVIRIIGAGYWRDGRTYYEKINAH